MNVADYHYRNLIEQVIEYGDLIETRNHEAYSFISSDTIVFVETPLVTLRKTAWKKALREMEWFLSGDAKCPEELLDWWDGQLDPAGKYLRGYGEQLRHWQGTGRWDDGFDQIQHLIEGIKEHPYSRRHVITTWNPLDMFRMTDLNCNLKTPTTCHLSMSQYFVRDVKLSARTYHRSCDLLLGAIHNWLQHWGLLLWLAKQTSLEVGSLIYSFGDLHVYKEDSHLAVVDAILESGPCAYAHRVNPKLVYTGSVGDEFKASDFELEGFIESPVSTIRPKLL